MRAKKRQQNIEPMVKYKKKMIRKMYKIKRSREQSTHEMMKNRND